MSVLLEFAMFPTDKGDSVSQHVSKVIDVVRQSGAAYQLTAMGTLVETDTMPEALNIINQAHEVLAENCSRIYTTINIDSQKGKSNRIKSKVKAIKDKIGDVNS